MSELSNILATLDRGEPFAAEQLLPLVYDELRRLAGQKLNQEAAGQTLDATALVHEAYLRLVGDQQFANRQHFFGAAAEAMRRILVDNARRKGRQRRGGTRNRVLLTDVPAITRDPDDLLAIDEALAALAEEDAEAAEVVKLRIYAGFSVEEAADALGISRASAYRQWTYARAWLRCRLDDMAES